MLIQFGANLEAMTHWQRQTALISAVTHGHHHVAEMLIKHGANNIEAKGKQDGATALMIASTLGNAESVSVLLKYGANAHAKNNVGMTAELMALVSGHSKVASMLERAVASSSSKQHGGSKKPKMADNRLEAMVKVKKQKKLNVCG